MVAGLHGHAQNAALPGRPSRKGPARLSPGGDLHGAVLAQLRRSRSLRPTTGTTLISSRGGATSGRSATRATWASGTRPFGPRSATSRRSTPTCRPPAWPSSAAVPCLSPAKASPRPSASATARSTTSPSRSRSGLTLHNEHYRRLGRKSSGPLAALHCRQSDARTSRVAGQPTRRRGVRLATKRRSGVTFSPRHAMPGRSAPAGSGLPEASCVTVTLRSAGDGPPGQRSISVDRSAGEKPTLWRHVLDPSRQGDLIRPLFVAEKPTLSGVTFSAGQHQGHRPRRFRPPGELFASL